MTCTRPWSSTQEMRNSRLRSGSTIRSMTPDLASPLVLLHHGLEGLQHLADGLEELRLVGILFADIFIDTLEIRIGKGKCHIAKPLCVAPARQAAEFER